MSRHDVSQDMRVEVAQAVFDAMDCSDKCLSIKSCGCSWNAADAILLLLNRAPSMSKEESVNAALLAFLAERGLRVVPVEPTEATLRSMATCIDHGFGAPPMGAYDYRKPNVKEWQKARLAEMAKCYAEVVGEGYAAAPDPFEVK